MFFPDRITGIREGHRVLEVGPGADPHPRSDVLLEMAFEDPEAYGRQFGHDRPLVTEKEVVYYDGSRFPFADGTFDYVICSHVVEHVPDVESFVGECFRVARRGYFEYPLCYYEYLYNFDVHLNLVKHTDGVLRYMKKSETAIDSFRPVQALLQESLTKGYIGTLNELLPWLMEGFQWEAPFPVQRVHDLASVCHAGALLPMRTEPPVHALGPRRLLRELAASIRMRILPPS
ncbi:MAG: methyltransferase domain-containing protein [Flavobacteriales bacterium]|jgi:SAM-dependent methyltransferase|nr:MAG: methyltransferase domain-containing protein [Flavobacteriales bacterium]